MTKHIKADPKIRQLMKLQASSDQEWFNDHPEHFIRIRFPTDADRAGLHAAGVSADGLNGVVVISRQKKMLCYAPCAIVPFSQMWWALHGEPYKDEDFFPDVKEYFKLLRGKKSSDQIFREFERRCAKRRSAP